MCHTPLQSFAATTHSLTIVRLQGQLAARQCLQHHLAELHRALHPSQSTHASASCSVAALRVLEAVVSQAMHEARLGYIATAQLVWLACLVDLHDPGRDTSVDIRALQALQRLLSTQHPCQATATAIATGVSTVPCSNMMALAAGMAVEPTTVSSSSSCNCIDNCHQVTTVLLAMVAHDAGVQWY